MIRAMVAAVPWPLLVAVAVALGVTLALAGMRWAHRRWPELVDPENNSGMSPFHGVILTLYAILMGLLVITAYGDLVETRADIDAEATALAQLSRDARALPGVDAVDAGIGRYVRLVVEEEWDAMRSGRSSAAALAELEGIHAALQSFVPADGREGTFLAQAVGDLDAAVAARRDRLAAMEEGFPGPLVAFVVGASLLIVIGSWIVGVKRRGLHAVLVAGLAGTLTFTIAVAFVLDYPFSSDQIGSDPYRLGALARYWAP